MQSVAPILFTQRGYDDLLKEYRLLKENRPAAVEDLSKARAMGDLSENGYYKSARMKLSSVDRRLRELSHIIRYAKVREKTSTDKIDIGSSVILTSNHAKKAYKIVGGYESDPSLGKLSYASPLGKALVGRRKGESITVLAPKGEHVYIIEEIS